MRRLLIVVDMQNDFVDGALGTPEAVAILPAVRARIEAAKENGEGRRAHCNAVARCRFVQKSPN